MELVLNLVGLLVALYLVSAWLHVWSQNSYLGTGRLLTQVVALVLLIVIVFPVISMTDDLYRAQNPAETASVHRRMLEVSFAHIASLHHSGLPTDELLRPPDQQNVWHSRREITRVSLPREPIFRWIENRPPPIA